MPGGSHWFENSDGFGREPVPNFEAVVRKPDSTGVGEYLICDVNGPGAIVRVWTAAIRGAIRMYLDSAGTPVYDGPSNRGFVTNNRWHILDCLPFMYRIGFYMEYYPHENTRDNAYARISYYYGRPGAIDDHVVITREDVRPQRLPDDWKPAARVGAANSVFYEAEDAVKLSNGILESSFIYGGQWTDGSCWRWKPERMGDTIDFTVPVSADGTYIIRLAFAMDKDSCRVSLKVDDNNAGFGGDSGVVDLYNPYRTLSRCLGTTSLTLAKGDHTVTLRCEGGGSDGLLKTVGIDFIWVQKR